MHAIDGLVHLLQLPWMLWTLVGVPVPGSRDAQPCMAMLSAAAPCIMRCMQRYRLSSRSGSNYNPALQPFSCYGLPLCSQHRSGAVLERLFTSMQSAAVRRRMSRTAQPVGQLRLRPCRSLAALLTRRTWARGPACRPAQATGAPGGCSRRRRAPLPPPRSAAPPHPACIGCCSQIA